MSFDFQVLDKQLERLRERKNSVLQLLQELNMDTTDLFHEKPIKSHFFSTNAKNLKELKVAAVMDRFTLDSYRPECSLIELTPGNWKEEIDTFLPDLIFIESAWQGKDGQWYRKIANGSKEYFEMTSYCQNKNIPIIFWNKEDPIYTDTFLSAARMADVVFTTDIDCIQKYKIELKNDQIYHLHFAAQPLLHNPIERYQRKDKFCFAGAYYHRYPKRAEVFDQFAQVFLSSKGFDIYDRNYQNALPEHAFPEQYNPYILGKLDPSEIEIAYKGYYYGVNMNSVNQSQTMFARRVFEMLASNTVTVGNYARGVKNYFGDLTICTDDKCTLQKYLNGYCTDEFSMKKYRLLGLRKVLSEHLYEDRLDFIVQKVFGSSLKSQLPLITVIAAPKGKEEKKRLKEQFQRQSYVHKRLLLVTDQAIEEKTYCVSWQSAQKQTIGEWIKEGWVAFFSSEDYYGENYLMDLALTLRYQNADGIGKASFFVQKEEHITLESAELYCSCNTIDTRKSIFKAELAAKYLLAELCVPIELYQGDFFAADEFNYCQNYTGKHCTFVDDLAVADQGIPLEQINQQGYEIKPKQFQEENEIKPAEIAKQLSKRGTSFFTVTQKDNSCFMESKLEAGKHQYVYFGEFYSVEKYQKNKTLTIGFSFTGTLDIIGVCIFYDGQKKKLSPAFTKANYTISVQVPEHAVYFELGIRPRGSGVCQCFGIHLNGTAEEEITENFLLRNQVLILTNHYPAPDDLYRNMFVHKRVSAYKEMGSVYDVMRMNLHIKPGYREFEGINIIEGQGNVLQNILDSKKVTTVCVHFLDKLMWDILKNYLDQIHLIIWLHGADIQPWWRRKCIFEGETELANAKKRTDELMQFWNEVFSMREKYQLKFVFVSRYFANMVEEDYHIQFQDSERLIIPNCIDTGLFSYEKKKAEQRKKIISIRPYASKIYGNDLIVSAIQKLSKTKEFKEMKFFIAGDGILFQETTKPLRKYKNVKIQKGFLRQEEIAALYKEYGIVLIPTRGDTQGVSRDEAMSAGLVPVTNAVAAIPEFTDEECAVLAPEEDSSAMAKGILNLVRKPEQFEVMSEAAAKRVRNQSSQEFTIMKELELIYSQQAETIESIETLKEICKDSIISGEVEK